MVITLTQVTATLMEGMVLLNESFYSATPYRGPSALVVVGIVVFLYFATQPHKSTKEHFKDQLSKYVKDEEEGF